MSDELDEMKASIEALQSKNRELLGELKVAKAKAKGAEIDPEQFAQLQNELEELRTQNEKLAKTSKAEIEKLSNALNEKDGALQQYLIDGGLTEALVKSGVRPELMKAAKAMLKSQAAIKADDGNYQALMGDAPLADAVAAWAASDEGKYFVSAPANSGGGATGGNNGNTTAPKGNLAGDKTQRTNAIAARFPELAKA